MRSRSMQGISSPVLIDEAGNRFGDYALLAMVENNDNQFKFKVSDFSFFQRGNKVFDVVLFILFIY